MNKVLKMLKVFDNLGGIKVGKIAYRFTVGSVLTGAAGELGCREGVGAVEVVSAVRERSPPSAR
jgi:hypothetical protein